MPVPPFVRRIRRTLGHDLLLLPGVAAVVFDPAGRVLLGKRADTGQWHLIGGIVEPGEQPADCCVREVYEEATVRCRVTALIGVYVTPERVYANGDQAQYVVTTFACLAEGGDEPRVGDDESTDVRYFDVAELPADVTEAQRAAIELARTGGPPAFVGGATYTP